MARKAGPWWRKDKECFYTTMDGKQVSLGVTDPKDMSGAWEALRKLVSETVKEAVGTQAVPIKPGSVDALKVAFLEAKRTDVNAATLKGYDKHLKWLAKHWGQVAVSALDVVLIRSKAASEPWGDTHRANTLWCVGMFLRWCGRTESIPLPPKEIRGGEAVIPEDVHRRIVNETSGDFRQLCRFLWLTGCRPGEATGLIAEAVDWNAGTVRLKRHKTRHKGKTRTLYLAKEALEVLTDQKTKYNGEGYLFRGLRSKPLSLQAMTMRFQRVSEKVGRVVTSYMYRHTWATRALSSGIPDTQVAAMLGHSSTAMIHRVYSHIGENARLLREVADKVAG